MLFSNKSGPASARRDEQSLTKVVKQWKQLFVEEIVSATQFFTSWPGLFILLPL